MVELEQKGCASVVYTKSFGNKARLDIQRVAQIRLQLASSVP